MHLHCITHSSLSEHPRKKQTKPKTSMLIQLLQIQKIALSPLPPHYLLPLACFPLSFQDSIFPSLPTYITTKLPTIKTLCWLTTEQLPCLLPTDNLSSTTSDTLMWYFTSPAQQQPKENKAPSVTLHNS